MDSKGVGYTLKARMVALGSKVEEVMVEPVVLVADVLHEVANLLLILVLM